MARKIPIFDKKTTTTHNNQIYNDTGATITIPYQNYYF